MPGPNAQSHFAPTQNETAQDEICVYIDGELVSFQGQGPVIVEQRTLVPVRGIFESLGFTAEWEQSAQTATLSRPGTAITIKEGDTSFIVNGAEYDLDVPAQVINGRVMLPFRALIESVGYHAYWDAANLAVLVFTDSPVEGYNGDDESGSTQPTDSHPADPLAQLRKDFTLPPPAGRRVTQGQPFGVDIHYNPDALLHGKFYVDGNSVSRFIGVLNSFRDKLPEPARIFCLLVPTSVEFLDEGKRAGIAGQFGPIQSIYGRLGSGVTPVDAYSRLAERAGTEYLYFRTDIHWTALGGYYAYLAFAEAAGLDPITIDNYIEFAIPNFIGLHVTGTPSKAVVTSPDTLYYYVLDNGTTFSRRFFSLPGESGAASYKLFFGGDHALIDFTSSNKNGKTLIVIKESYANAFIPWAAPHYERVVVIDPRHYDGKVSAFLTSARGQASKETQSTGSQNGPRTAPPHDIDILFIMSANAPSYPGFVSNIANLVQ